MTGVQTCALPISIGGISYIKNTIIIHSIVTFKIAIIHHITRISSGSSFWDRRVGNGSFRFRYRSFIISICPVCGIIGTMFSGVISDKLFGGRRNVPALIFGLMNVFALCLFLLVPGAHFWIDVLAMVLFGLGIGVLICLLGGLMDVAMFLR